MGQTLGKTIFEEGQEEGTRSTLLLQGRIRFGEPDAKTRQIFNRSTTWHASVTCWCGYSPHLPGRMFSICLNDVPNMQKAE